MGGVLSRVRLDCPFRTQYSLRGLTVFATFVLGVLARSMTRDIDAALSTSAVINSTIT